MRLLVTFFIALIAVQCSSHHGRDELNSITLRTEGCFGECPVYSLKIKSDGSAFYEAKDIQIARDVSPQPCDRKRITP
jgi:hypothetical protein